MKELLGFIYVALGCAVIAVSLLTGSVRPWLPIGLVIVLVGVIVLLLPLDGPR